LVEEGRKCFGNGLTFRTLVGCGFRVGHGCELGRAIYSIGVSNIGTGISILVGMLLIVDEVLGIWTESEGIFNYIFAGR
jgi:hypothetical protein